MKKYRNNIWTKILVLSGLVWMSVSCEDPYEDSTYVNDDNLPPLALTMSADTAATGWVEVLEYAGMYDALNYALDVFTVFLPTNEALDSFYTAKGVSSIQELGKQYAIDLVKTHTVLDSLKIDDITKKSALVNLAGDQLVVGVYMGDAKKFILLDEGLTSRSEVVEAEIKAYNGYIYRMNAVINPLNESVYEKFAKGGKSGDSNRYSIMNQALLATGWADSLSVIQDTLWYTSGSYKVTRRYYTLLAVADETFQKDDISSFDALVQKLGATADYTSRTNELNQYVAYHILKASNGTIDLKYPLNMIADNAMMEDGTFEEYFTSDSVKLMDTAAEDMILQLTRRGQVSGTESYIFNEQAESASLIDDYSDVLAKNGFLHELDGYLPVWKPEQSLLVWDLADYVSVKSAVETVGDDLYKPAEPVSSECKVSLASLTDVYTYEQGPNGTGGNTYHSISYVNCKKNLSDANNNDRVVFNLGYMGWVEMKTPTLVRGKYRVELDFIYTFDHSFMRTMSDGNGGLMKFTFDGENEKLASPYTTVSKNSVGVYSTVLYDEIEFDRTASHLMKFIVMDPAASTNGKFSLQFDCIRFIPITE